MFQTIITAEELHQHLNHSDWVVFDCRFNLMDTDAGFANYQVGHIPGAFYLHLDNDLSSEVTPETGRHPLPDPLKLSSALSKAGVSTHIQVVVYDDCGGAMASRAWWLLKWLGHDEVAVLDGGFPAWSSQYPVDNEIPEAEAARFETQLRSSMNLSVDELQSALNDADILLVDARAAERFRGEVEPIDPVAGHVPGAANRPLTDNLDNGCFKSSEQLKSEWLELLQGQPCNNMVHMCGSGVTACHNLLAMEIAGLKGSRVYSGSWSEWIRDPARPVAKG